MAIRIEEHRGQRGELRALFELAEDSERELNSYLEAGRVLVARDGAEVIGHLQLVEGARPGEAQIKNMAVVAAHRRRGVGRLLVEAAIELSRAESRELLSVATAAADTGNLRFYQRLGFRMRSIERDAFTPANGYEEGASIDGIPLRDRVWLDLSPSD